MYFEKRPSRIAKGLILFALSATTACTNGSTPVASTGSDAANPVPAPHSPKNSEAAQARPTDSDPPQASAGAPLSDVERNTLIYVREEEKLARDVYLALDARFGLRVFQNISSSESAHTEAIRGLLAKYDIPDPAEGNPAGRFTDGSLQKLHDELIARGQRSAIDALKVGAQIEELDIVDLERRLEDAAHADVRAVLEHLRDGSTNHLRAFERNLRRRGVVYTPVHLSETRYTEVIAAPHATGSCLDCPIDW